MRIIQRMQRTKAPTQYFVRTWIPKRTLPSDLGSRVTQLDQSLGYYFNWETRDVSFAFHYGLELSLKSGKQEHPQYVNCPHVKDETADTSIFLHRKTSQASFCSFEKRSESRARWKCQEYKFAETIIAMIFAVRFRFQFLCLLNSGCYDAFISSVMLRSFHNAEGGHFFAHLQYFMSLKPLAAERKEWCIIFPSRTTWMSLSFTARYLRPRMKAQQDIQWGPSSFWWWNFVEYHYERRFKDGNFGPRKTFKAKKSRRRRKRFPNMAHQGRNFHDWMKVFPTTSNQGTKIQDETFLCPIRSVV